MDLDDREWLRREREERRQAGHERGCASRRSLGAPNPLLTGVAALALLLVTPTVHSPLAYRTDTPPVDTFEPAARSDALLNVPVAAPGSVPQSLQTCLNGSTLIDETVIRCQHGGALPSVHAGTGQGMVSRAYLAQYRAEQDRRAVPTRAAAFSEHARVRGFDSPKYYLAYWWVNDNQIDSASVCANHRRGSFDYRECRKAAKLHFRAQCHSAGGPAQQRFCAAESGFNPVD